jgi:hypothetical protein
LGRHLDEPASGVAVGARAEGRHDCNGGEPEVKWGWGGKRGDDW